MFGKGILDRSFVSMCLPALANGLFQMLKNEIEAVNAFFIEKTIYFMILYSTCI